MQLLFLASEKIFTNLNRLRALHLFFKNPNKFRALKFYLQAQISSLFFVWFLGLFLVGVMSHNSHVNSSLVNCKASENKQCCIVCNWIVNVNYFVVKSCSQWFGGLPIILSVFFCICMALRSKHLEACWGHIAKARNCHTSLARRSSEEV